MSSLLILGSICATALAGPDNFPLTMAALQERYADEIIAHRRYGAYAGHADNEGYPAIAHLFRALASSEAVHARNFAQLLRASGVQPLTPTIKLVLSNTREHLQQAATVEADEIDQEYPAILESIDAEQHRKAIEFITYAWKAERQHRELILKIKKGAGWFFGMLVSRIEGSPTRYYVCQICGSTVTELPGSQCPICDHPPEQYREVPEFPGDSTESTPSGG